MGRQLSEKQRRRRHKTERERERKKTGACNHAAVNFKRRPKKKIEEEEKKTGAAVQASRFFISSPPSLLPPLRSNPLQLRFLPFLLITLRLAGTCANCGGGDALICFASLEEFCASRGTTDKHPAPGRFWKRSGRLSRADGRRIVAGWEGLRSRGCGWLVMSLREGVGWR